MVLRKLHARDRSFPKIRPGRPEGRDGRIHPGDPSLLHLEADRLLMMGVLDSIAADIPKSGETPSPHSS